MINGIVIQPYAAGLAELEYQLEVLPPIINKIEPRVNERFNRGLLSILGVDEN